MTASDHALSPTRPPCSLVRVPGKVILSGEHAVVYGTPALACAIQKYAFAKVVSIDIEGVHLTVPALGIDQHFSNLQLTQLALNTQLRHQHFVNDSGLLSNVVASPVQFFAAALGASGLVDLLSNQPGLGIELTMDLVAGGGMGSSAALVAAMLAAAFKHIGQPLTAQQLILKTTQSEHWQHGRSSGLDPYVCVMGGLQRYEKGTGQRQVLKQLSACFLVTTGKPDSSTGECVEAVKQHAFSDHLWRQFGQVQEDLLQCMLKGSPVNRHHSVLNDRHVSIQVPHATAMVNAIAANHKLLQHIGVVPKAVAGFVAEIESNGGAAKICGAGSVVGDHAGLVFVVGLELAHIKELCLNYAYGVQEMLPDLEGVVYFD